MGIVAPAYVQLHCVTHVDHMNDLARIGADRLKHNIVDVFPVLRLRGIVVNNVEHFLAICAGNLVRVWCFAQLTLEILPEVSRHDWSGLHDPLVGEPGHKASLVDVLH